MHAIFTKVAVVQFSACVWLYKSAATERLLPLKGQFPFLFYMFCHCASRMGGFLVSLPWAPPKVGGAMHLVLGKVQRQVQVHFPSSSLSPRHSGGRALVQVHFPWSSLRPPQKGGHAVGATESAEATASAFSLSFFPSRWPQSGGHATPRHNPKKV